MRKIEETYFNGSQSVEFKGIYNHNGNKIKIHIDIDSVGFQSSAICYVFNKQELKWNVLDSIHHSQMKSKVVHAYRKVDEYGRGLAFSERDAIESDIKTLKKKAKQILD